MNFVRHGTYRTKIAAVPPRWQTGDQRGRGGGHRGGQGARGGGCGTRRDGAAPEPLATKSHQSPGGGGEGEPGAPRGRGRGGPGAGGGGERRGAQVPGVGGLFLGCRGAAPPGSRWVGWNPGVGRKLHRSVAGAVGAVAKRPPPERGVRRRGNPGGGGRGRGGGVAVPAVRPGVTGSDGVTVSG